MLKAAHLTASLSRQAGGLFEAILRQVQAHDRQKVDTRVFALWDEATEADLPAWQPVPAMAFKAIGPKSLGYSPRFREELQAFVPDLVHTHGLWGYPSIATTVYSQKNRRPFLISPHGMLDPWALKNSRWKKRLAYALFEQSHLRGARCLRALCHSEAQSIRQLGLKNPIAIIPNGIDLPEIESAGNLKAEFATAGEKENIGGKAPWQDHVEPGCKVLLFLSRIHPKKGLVNLLKAWAEIQNSTDWVLAIAGWDQGGHEAELKQLCTELQLPFADLRELGSLVRDPRSMVSSPWSVLFLGPQFNAAKQSCYQHCDAFVLPSFSEGLPMVVLEAWANSKPVIMTPACNLPEGFQVGAALQVEPTEASIAAGLKELGRMTPTERVTMGQRARELVAARFAWSRVTEQMETVYDWMLGGGTKPDCLMEVNS